MSKKHRKQMSRAEFLAERERKYRQAAAEPGAKTIYHVRHSCGHAVYWDDIDAGLLAESFPCIWCGAATGMPIPPDDIVCSQRGHVRRNPQWRCGKHETEDMTIVAKHKTDETCCQGAGSIN